MKNPRMRNDKIENSDFINKKKRLIRNNATSNKCIEKKLLNRHVSSDSMFFPDNLKAERKRNTTEKSKIQKYVYLSGEKYNTFRNTKLTVINYFEDANLNRDNISLYLDDYENRFEAPFCIEKMNGKLYLKLRWLQAWGNPPSNKMSLKNLKVFLKCYKLSNDSFMGISQKENGFSKVEKKWIMEVFQKSEIYSRIFNYYFDLPKIELCRVSKLPDNSKGLFDEDNGKKISIADFNGKKEDSFKKTLLHELYHFIDRQTSINYVFWEDIVKYLQGKLNLQDLFASVIIPNHLNFTLAAPTTLGIQFTQIKNYYKPFMFGFFIAPLQHGKKLLDVNEKNVMEYLKAFYMKEERPRVLTRINNDLGMFQKTFRNDSFLNKFYTIYDYNIIHKFTSTKKVFWELATRYGGYNAGSTREDLANIFSEYLHSISSRKTLKIKFPLRFKLMDWYIRKLN